MPYMPVGNLEHEASGAGVSVAADAASRHLARSEEARGAAQRCPDPVLRGMLYDIADAYKKLAEMYARRQELR